MNEFNENQSRGTSLVSLIVWVSVCLLSASWGPLIPESLRHGWAYYGLFGLAAGLGLSAMERSRTAIAERQERKESQVRLEHHLSKLGSCTRRVDSKNRLAS